MSKVTVPNFLRSMGTALLIGAGIGQYQTTGMIGPVKTRRYYLYRYYGIQWDEWERGERTYAPSCPEWEELPPEYRSSNLFCWQEETGDTLSFWERFKSAHVRT